MTKFLLVRHGRSAWNAEGRIQGQIDIPLDEVGLEQGRRIADRLKSFEFSAIYASPLQRARVTAELIGAAADLPVQCDERLMEYNFGAASGLTWDGVVASHPEFAQRWAAGGWTVPIEGSEGREAFARRVCAVMETIATQQPDSTVVVVAHGGTFSVYLAAMLGLDLKRRQPFHFGNTSLSLVETQPGRFQIHFLNDVCHLPPQHADKGVG